MKTPDDAGDSVDVDALLASDLQSEGFEEPTVIGRGGFGVVLRCRQPTLDRTVAVKVLTGALSRENLERFLREQRALGRLSGHPNIVNVHFCGTTASGRPYIVMQYYPRGSLDARIRRRGPLGWREALSVGVKMAGALETAHRASMLHRDVKPSNILLSDYGEPCLADFGIARVAGGFETATGIITGSPAYTAPEVLGGEAPSPASDVYSLGATLFCAVTGHAAFERREGENLVAQFVRISDHLSPSLDGTDIPAGVITAIEHAMQRDPSARPSTALEFGRDLQRVAEDHALTAVDLFVPEPAEDGSTREAPYRQPRMPDRTEAIRHWSGSVTMPPAPSTKYRPPTPNRPLVERGRLVGVLRSGKGRRLILIHAPAGYGKTTLAAQWREVLTAEGTAVAWLSIDPDDNNVVWFLSHLVDAIRLVRPGLAQTLGQVLQEHGDQATRYVLSTLINEIDDAGTEVAVVLDDWHRVSSRETQDAVAFVLENCCAQLQVVVTSRTRSGLPLSRLQVLDQVLEIDAQALRFDATESREFLVDLGGLLLGEREVEDLTDSTDGWVAALQLASLSLRGCEDPAHMIGSLSGRHRAIGAFLAENVLDTLEPALLDFLMATSVTGRISGDLASALADVPDGQSWLEDVERRDLFLRRIDDEGEWFRYHHLFAEFLRRRLERSGPERIADLHRRAARWFVDRHFLSEAVDHALASGDENQAVEYVVRHRTYLLEHSQMSTLLGLVAKLPPNAVAGSAALQLAVAWANLLLHHVGPARAAFDRIRPTLDAGNLDASERDSIRVEASVAEAALEIYADRTSGVETLVEEALENSDAVRPWAVTAAANIKTFCLIYRFDYAAVMPLQNWARRYHASMSGPFTVMYGAAFAGIAAFEQLDLAAAELHFVNAVESARRVGGAHSHASRLAGALLGELRYAQGEVDEAERLIEESYQLGSEGGVVDFMIARYVVGAAVKARRGDRAAAAEHLEAGARAAQLLGLDRLRARVDNERILLGLSPGAGASFPQTFTDASSMDGIAQITAQVRDDSAIRLLLMRGSSAATERALAWARHWYDMLVGTERRRSTLAAIRLLVSCLIAGGRVEEAKVRLAEAAAVCAEQGMVRFLPDGGVDVVGLLRALRDDQQSGRWREEWAAVPAEFLRIVSAAADGDPGGPSR